MKGTQQQFINHISLNKTRSFVEVFEFNELFGSRTINLSVTDY